MAKNKKKTGLTREQQQRLRAEEQEQLRRGENARKSYQMGMIFLYAFLSLVALFCLYLTVRTLFFPAASLEELQSNYLFLSIVALPYLVGTAAVILRGVRNHRAEDPGRPRGRGSMGLFLAVLLVCVLALTGQLFGGRSDASAQPIFQNAAAALESSGLDFTAPEEVPAFRTLLVWDAAQGRYTCGQTRILLDRCDTGFGIPARLARQTALDLKDLTPESTAWGTRWLPAPVGDAARAGLCLQNGSRVLALELTGPQAELEVLYPALERAILERANLD